MKKLVDSELLAQMLDLAYKVSHQNSDIGIEAECLGPAIRAALDAPQQEAVATVRDPYDTPGLDWHCPHPPRTGDKPEGWQLVPKEPTTEMMAVHDDLLMQGVPRGRNLIYKAMLLAAPKAPSTDDRKDAEHVCGLQGFGQPGDTCPACAQHNAGTDAKKGEKE